MTSYTLKIGVWNISGLQSKLSGYFTNFAYIDFIDYIKLYDIIAFDET